MAKKQEVSASALEQLRAQGKRNVEAEHQAALDMVIRPLGGLPKYAAAELPKIKAALAEWDSWYKENVQGKDWSAIPGGMPRAIGDATYQIEKAHNNPNVVREGLKELAALTWQNCWGTKKSGEFDINRPANLRGSISAMLSCAQGCAGGIKTNLSRAKAALDDLEKRLEWEMASGLMKSPQKGAAIVPTGEAGLTMAVSRLLET